MDKIADSVITTGESLLGINIRNVISQPPFRDAHVFFAKGQSNFETIMVQKDLITQPVVFLLMAKCPYIANYLGVLKGELVAKLST